MIYSAQERRSATKGPGPPGERANRRVPPGPSQERPAVEHRSPYPPTVLFAPPDTDEAAALAVAARYLSRAGTAAGSRLLGLRVDAGEAALAVALRDSLLAGAALCAGLLDPEAGGRDRR